MFAFGLTILATALAASSAGAQFTTVMTPPKRNTQAANVAQQTAAAKKDSIQRVAIVDMKAWVDSVAGVMSAGVDTTQDTTRRVATKTDTAKLPVAVAKPSRPDTARMRGGMPAPATATPLPMIALLGAGLVIGGLALRRRVRA